MPQQLQGLGDLFAQIVDSKNSNVSNKSMRSVSNKYYSSLNYHQQPNIHFNSSENYIEKTKDLFGFSTRSCHLKRMPTAKPNEEHAFIKRCRCLMENPNKKHILNADESFARSNQFTISPGQEKVQMMFL